MISLSKNKLYKDVCFNGIVPLIYTCKTIIDGTVNIVN